jgi:hypothetical protein
MTNFLGSLLSQKNTGSLLFASSKVHKAFANHSNFLKILMSNMAAPTLFLQIHTTIITEYFTNGEEILPQWIYVCAKSN